jgi:ATP-binding cassette, subfamily B, bacterial
MWDRGGGRGMGWGHMSRENEAASGKLKYEHLGRIAGYLRPYIWHTVVIFLCIAGTTAIGLVPPLIIRAIIDKALPAHNGRLLNLLVLGMILVPVGSGFLGVLQNYLNARVGQAIMFDLRNQLFAHLQRMSLRFYVQTQTGQIMSRVNNDVGAVQNAVTGTLVGIVTSTVTVASTLAVIFALNAHLAILACVILPAFVAPMRSVGRFRQRISKQTQQRQADLTAHMEERLSISGFILTRVFGRQADERQRFRTINQDLMGLQIRQTMVGRWFYMLMAVLSAVGPALIYWYGGHLVISASLTIGTVVAFVAYLGNLYRPVTNLANVYVDLRGALGVFDRIFEYLDMVPEVRDEPGATALPPVRGRVTFRDVSFSYKGADRPAIDDISFDIQPGQLVALVGPSGAGKTTITTLVPRFYDPDRGTVEIDGKDVRHVTLDSLGAQLAMVTQETFLFHTTIMENLRYARPDAKEGEIIAAAQAANIHDFIASLPEAYETVVGERGYRLSGGEKQRLAIARAILKDPNILILDEATSALDSTSESLIQAALVPLMKGRTSIVIAHRLSTILAADVILVIDHGRLVERGNHAELLALNGLYATLYRQQFRDPPKMQAPSPAEEPVAGARRGPWRRRSDAELAEAAASQR